MASPANLEIPDPPAGAAGVDLASVLQLCPAAIALTRLADGALIECNDAWLAMAGLARAAIRLPAANGGGIWADPVARAEVLAQVAAGEVVSRRPVAIRHADGSLRHLLLSASPVARGASSHGIERLLAPGEGEGEAAAHHLRAILDNLPSLIAYWDADLRNRFANHAYWSWLGIDPARMPGMHLRDVLGEERYRLNRPYIEGALRGERQIFERQIDSADGRVRSALAEYVPDIVAGQVRGFYVVVSDITPIKEAESAFRDSEERYRKVVEDQTELIGRYMPDGRMIFVNDVYCRFFGKSESELRGRSWHPVAHPDDVPMIEAELARLCPEVPVVTIENRVYAGDGREHWMQFVNRAFFDAAGRIREIQSVGRDISARKRAEQELADSRQQLYALLEANDQLRERQRKEIAHEIHDQLGALLTAIGFRLDALNHLLRDDPAASAALGGIKALVARASGAARDICNNLRPPVLDDLGLIPACRWYLHDWSRLVAISAKGRFGRLPEVLSERLSTDLFRVFQELLNNVAKHAGATRVRVSISCGTRALRLLVADDGRGLAQPGKPGGFGLAGIRERMARHGGQVSIVSASSGTAVSVSIPVERLR